MMLPLKVRRSTMAAQSRGSVNVFDQPSGAGTCSLTRVAAVTGPYPVPAVRVYLAVAPRFSRCCLDRVPCLTAYRRRLPGPGAVADAREGGGVFRLHEAADRHRPEVRAGRKGLCDVPDPVSPRAPFGGGITAGQAGRALQPRPVRQAPRPLRQGCPHLRAAAALGAPARRLGPDAAVVPGGRAVQVPGLAGAVRRRVRRQPASRNDPQPASLSHGTRRAAALGAVQPACPCAEPARPTTTNAASTSWRSSRCSVSAEAGGHA